MKVLQLSSKVPYPPVDGGAVGMHNMTKALLSLNIDVKILAVNTPKYTVNVETLDEEYRRNTKIETVLIDTTIRVLPALKAFLSRKSYHVERFISKAFASKLEDLLKREQFDIIQFETIYLTPYIPIIRKYSKAKLVLRAHNVEYMIWKRIASHIRQPLKRFYVNHLSRMLEAYEKELSHNVDGVLTVSSLDAQFFLKQNPNLLVTSIPSGIDIVDNTGVVSEPESIFYLGAMNWQPNEDGIRWFLGNVWQRLHEAYPKLKFYIAGRFMPEWMKNIKMPNVVVVGEVADAYQFMLSKGIMVVPLFSGSGIRIKILEAMMLGKPVITTSMGLEGIDAINNEHVLLAENATEFIDCIGRCMKDMDMCTILGENARNFITARYNHKVTAENLQRFYTELLQQ